MHDMIHVTCEMDELTNMLEMLGLRGRANGGGEIKIKTRIKTAEERHFFKMDADCLERGFEIYFASSR